MPETLDFNTIALRVLVDLEPFAADVSNSATRQAMAIIAEQLRMVWNARGGVDIAALESAFHPDFGNGRPSMKTLDAVLRALDR